MQLPFESEILPVHRYEIIRIERKKAKFAALLPLTDVELSKELDQHRLQLVLAADFPQSRWKGTTMLPRREMKYQK